MSNLWVAASDNDIDAVKKFLEAGEYTANSKDENGYTPIHAAASYGHKELLRYLIENGGDPNITDGEGDTPLHAVEDVETAQLLLELGAELAKKNQDDQTPLDKAVDEQEYPELINFLMIKSGKQPENIELTVNYEDPTTDISGEQVATEEQRKKLGEIIQNGTDADLEKFLQETVGGDPDASGSSGRPKKQRRANDEQIRAMP